MINFDKTAKHCMIDLETLGTNSQAPVIQIGIAIFSIEKGIEQTSEWTINFNDALKYGKPDGDTIKWWLQQSEEARRSVTKNLSWTSSEAVDNLVEMLSLYMPSCYWAHATFDFPILNNLLKELKQWFHLPFRTCFDMRTLEFIAQLEKWHERKGTHHTAKEDAIYQAECVLEMLRKLEQDNDK